MDLNQISQPTLVIDTEKVKRNIGMLAKKAEMSNTILRPHVKTIHSPEIAEFFKPYGIQKITVSNAEMAFRFAKAGWNDILLAFPLNSRQKMLYQKIIAMLPPGKMHFTAENKTMATWLSELAVKPISVWIKLDTGQRRTGIPAENIEEIQDLYEHIRQLPGLECKGLLSHFGQLYGIRNADEKLQMIELATKRMQAVRNALPQETEVKLSAGDTPSAASLETLAPFDEFRAGNFVYFDAMQWSFGNCQLVDIAVSVYCPVLVHHANRHQSIIHGGAVHFARDFIRYPEDEPCYGLVVRKKSQQGDLEIIGFVVSVSQEHGIIQWMEGQEAIKPGELVSILPIHSCHTAFQLQANTIVWNQGD